MMLHFSHLKKEEKLPAYFCQIAACVWNDNNNNFKKNQTSLLLFVYFLCFYMCIFYILVKVFLLDNPLLITIVQDKMISPNNFSYDIMYLEKM